VQLARIKQSRLLNLACFDGGQGKDSDTADELAQGTLDSDVCSKLSMLTHALLLQKEINKLVKAAMA